MPARFPNLLANGTTGIAVGMATNIPPHNVGELIDGLLAMIENPDISITELNEDYIFGPDFPTGAYILGRSGIRRAYETGRGSVMMRAVCEVEQLRNGRKRIVVSELPYQVNKEMLVKKIADLHHEKRIEGISDLRDESNRVGIKVVIDRSTAIQLPKSNAICERCVFYNCPITRFVIIFLIKYILSTEKICSSITLLNELFQSLIEYYRRSLSIENIPLF